MTDIINNKPRIIFMGTPEFAVASLDALVQAGSNIIAVITAPDKPAGARAAPHGPRRDAQHSNNA